MFGGFGRNFGVDFACVGKSLVGLSSWIVGFGLFWKDFFGYCIEDGLVEGRGWR